MPVTCRPLEEGDFEKGYIYILSQLTTVGDVTQDMFSERLAEIKNGPEYIFVAEDTDSGRLLGTGALLIERKFIHECGKVGHIEDVVVDEGARGLGLGRLIVDHLTDEARARGCYKVILNCSEENAPFYEKQGYGKKEVQMAVYF